MTNGAKLIIIVLGFFLALTYVRGFDLAADSHEVVFSGNQPYTFNVAVTNTSNTSMTPNFIADGPFTIVLPADAESIPRHDTKAFALALYPSKSFRVGDVYSGQIRVLSSEGEKSLPLTFRMQNAPLFAPGTGLFSFVSFTLPSVSTITVVDGVLMLIIVILGIALVAQSKTASSRMITYAHLTENHWICFGCRRITSFS